MSEYSTKLRDDLNIIAPKSTRLASSMAMEIRGMDKGKVIEFATGELVELRSRMDELRGFEIFIDYGDSVIKNPGMAGTILIPGLTRAMVMTQLYVSFVYLNEACFSKFRKIAPDGSLVKKCCKAINDNPIRGIKNAVAHANWKYNEDFSGLLFNYFKDESKNTKEVLELSQIDLNFWSTLSRMTACVIYETANEMYSQ